MQACFSREIRWLADLASSLRFWRRCLRAPAARAQAGGEVERYLADAGRRRQGARQQMRRRHLRRRGLAEGPDRSRHRQSPQVDDKNPNPALAKRPMIGLPLFSGMRPSGPNKWSGQIYNADDGNSYASNISVAGPDTLRVEGCVGALCGGETWTRRADARSHRTALGSRSRLMQTQRRHRLQRRRRRGIAAARAVDEMHVIAAQRRGREAGHHRGILPVQAVSRDPCRGRLREALRQRALQFRRAIEDHAQSVVIFAEVGILHHLLHIGLRHEAADADAEAHDEIGKQRMREHDGAPLEQRAAALRRAPR